MIEATDVYASRERFDFQRMVAYWARELPDKVAIQEKSRRVTYAELDRMVDGLVAGLRDKGLAQGDVVVSALPTCHEAMVVFFAAAKAGLVLVPCNPLLGVHETRDWIGAASPKAAFVMSGEVIDLIAADNEGCVFVSVRFGDDRCVPFEDMLVPGSSDPALIDPKADTLVVVFTSGSTGEPKGIELSYWSLFHSAYNCSLAMKADRSDRIVMPMPISHLFGLGAGMTLPICYGATILLMEKFNAQAVLELVEREQASVLYGVPTMFIRELAEMKKRPARVDSLRVSFIAGASSSKELVADIKAVLGCDVVIAYGCTESGSVSATAMDDAVEMATETVGRAFDGVVARVLDENGERRKVGEGELVCKSPTAMKGYYREPEKTAKVLRDGWVHTGDYVSIDEEGYIRVLGRVDAMMIRGGYNVHAPEVERLYASNPLVLECCAFPISHPDLGQQIGLAVRLVDGAQATPEELREYAKGRIAKYKIPDRVFFLEELPKLPIGKYDVKALRETCIRLCGKAAV